MLTCVPQLPNTQRQVDSVLRTLLTKALDVNTFHVSSSVTEQSTLDEAVVVDQTSTMASKTPSARLASPADARCVAIVDRSANVDDAARAITLARFSFGGSSPYAPDLVLVNEFVKKDFFEACSRYATLAFARDNNGRDVSGSKDDVYIKAVEDAESKGQVSCFGSKDFKLVDVLDRSVTSSPSPC